MATIKRLWMNRLRNTETKIKRQGLYINKLKEVGTLEEWIQADKVLMQLRHDRLELKLALEL